MFLPFVSGRLNPPTGTQSDTESNTKYKAAPQWLSMHSELFEFYTPTKDRLSKPMPEWIFHTERGRARGSRGEQKEGRGGGKKKKKTGGGEREGETAGGGGESEGDAVKRRWLAGEH